MMRSLVSLGLMAALACLPVPSLAEVRSATGFELRSGDHVLTVRAQTTDEAYAYLVDQLGQMEFFRANGYQVALPAHPAFGEEAVTPGSAEVFASEVYKAAEFETALASLASEASILQQVLDRLAASSNIEGLRSYDQYTVTLTLYGPGGSYDPESGTIVLWTTSDGRFKGGGAVHTVAHEMMHLAIEDGLVQRFGLRHWEKERLVDLLVQREFSEILPDYELQSLGEEALDPYVKSVPFDQVAEAVERYMAASQGR